MASHPSHVHPFASHQHLLTLLRLPLSSLILIPSHPSLFFPHSGGGLLGCAITVIDDWQFQLLECHRRDVTRGPRFKGLRSGLTIQRFDEDIISTEEGQRAAPRRTLNTHGWIFSTYPRRLVLYHSDQSGWSSVIGGSARRIFRSYHRSSGGPPPNSTYCHQFLAGPAAPPGPSR
jgi:hypothetical protein